MKIGILGTGIVGRTHAARLSGLGHDVLIGTQNVERTMAETKSDAMGNVPFSVWQKDHPKVKLAVFEDAARHGEMVINALRGEVASDVIKKLVRQLDGKILIDISNPLDFSQGMPPSLTVCNDDSLGEEIQRSLPKTKVVKTLNTVTAALQVSPEKLSAGDHHIFMSGNDKEAKTAVLKILKDGYGWKNVIDLGDITTARGTEMALPLWVRLFGVLRSPMFNFKIVTDK